MYNKRITPKISIVLGILSIVMSVIPIIGLISGGLGFEISKTKKNIDNTIKLGYRLSVAGFLLSLTLFLVSLMWLIFFN